VDFCKPLVHEREKQLLDMDTAWRKKAARAEMAGRG
jgi:hypothetical protein